MKKISLIAFVAALFCSCQHQQQGARVAIQKDVPIYTVVEKELDEEKKKLPKAKLTDEDLYDVSVDMVSVYGPEGKVWNLFDRDSAVKKYNEMPAKDKEILFDEVATTYRHLRKNNTLSSDAINTGIWKKVTCKGVDLSFGEDAADWHPYLMYIHPIVVEEMTNIFLAAKKDCITNKELNDWQKAGRNLINARPDNLSMATLLNHKNELAQAGIILKQTKDGYVARTKRINWNRYRKLQQPAN